MSVSEHGKAKPLNMLISNMRFVKQLNYTVIFYFSFTLNKILKAYFNFIYHNVIGKLSKTAEWKLFSEKFSVPGSLMYVMLNAPRWNTHAIIVTAGVLNVKRTLTFTGLIHLNVYCQSWTLVIYTQPDNKTFRSISEQDITTDALTAELPEGKYSIGLRLYNTRFPVCLPSITIDNKEEVLPRQLDVKPALYPDKIVNKKGVLYYIIHQYVYLLMCNKIHRDNAYIKKEYLPVGNPETIFKYGVILKNKSIQIHLEQDVLNNFLVYLTVYNLCSFPVLSEQILTEKYSSSVFPHTGTYLIRMVALADKKELVDQKDIHIFFKY